MDEETTARINHLEAEVKRLSEAMQHIANGNISPSITFACKVMEGMDVRAAHKAAVQRHRSCLSED